MGLAIAFLVPEEHCPRGYQVWDASKESAFCSDRGDDWGFDAHDLDPLRIAIAGLGLVAAGCALILRRGRRMVLSALLLVALGGAAATMAIRPLDSLSQRAFELDSRIPCPDPRCAGLSVQEAFRGVDGLASARAAVLLNNRLYRLTVAIEDAAARGASDAQVRDYVQRLASGQPWDWHAPLFATSGRAD